VQKQIIILKYFKKEVAMNAGDLLKDQEFRVNGWPDDIVLTVTIPSSQNIYNCAVREKNTYMTGLAILAHQTGNVEELYSIPIIAKVTAVE
jgi:hypothetical protein